MPTQEERLQTVEFDLRQFKTETIKAYGDMAFEMTIIKGLTENAIGRLATLSSPHDHNFYPYYCYQSLPSSLLSLSTLKH